MPGQIEHKSAEFVQDSESSEADATSLHGSEPSRKRKLSSSPTQAAKRAKHTTNGDGSSLESGTPAGKSEKKKKKDKEGKRNKEMKNGNLGVEKDGEKKKKKKKKRREEDNAAQTPSKENEISNESDLPFASSIPEASQEADFDPPHGFEPILSDAQRSETLQDLFKVSNLSSKHLWHITVPASVPIKDISQMRLGDIQNQKPVLSVQDEQYSFRSESKNTLRSSRLISEQEEETSYTLGPTFTASYHLERVVQLPNTQASRFTGHDARHTQVSATFKKDKGPRLQPEGLRTRYWPPGFEIRKKQAVSRPVKGGERSESEATSSEESEFEDISKVSQAQPIKAGAVNGNMKSKEEVTSSEEDESESESEDNSNAAQAEPTKAAAVNGNTKSKEEVTSSEEDESESESADEESDSEGEESKPPLTTVPPKQAPPTKKENPPSKDDESESDESDSDGDSEDESS